MKQAMEALLIGLLAAAIAPAATVRGRLVDEATELPVVGGVELFEEEDDAQLVDRLIGAEPRVPLATVRTGADGTFTLEWPGSDRAVSVEAVAPGHGRVFVARGLFASSETALSDTRLPPGRTLRGRVRDGAGAPVGGALIVTTTKTTTEWEALPVVTAVSGEDGSFVLEGAPGRAEVVCHALGRGIARAKVDGPTPASLTFTLESPLALSGRVVDRAGGKPIAGAVVRDGGLLATRTDASGRFTLRDLAAGKVSLAIDSGDHVPAFWSGSVPAPAGAPGPTIALGAGARLDVVVLDARDRKPLASARVSASDGRRERRAMTDAAGVARLGGLPASVELHVVAKGYEPEHVEHACRPGPAVRLPIAVRPLARLSGIVVDEDGRPIGGATVLSTNESWGRADRSTRTDASGSFRLLVSNSTRFLVTLCADAPELPRTCVHPKLSAGEVRHGLRLELRRGAVVTGQVQDNDGKPLAGADVELERWSYTGGYRGTTDEEGRYRLVGVPAGKLAVLVTRSGFVARWTSTVEVVGTAEVMVPAVRLSPGKPVSGRVVDAARRPVEGASVHVSDDADDRDVTTDSTGTFTLPDLDPSRPCKLVVTSRRERVEMEATPGGEPVEVVLEGSGLLRGRLTARDGSVVTRAGLDWNLLRDGVDARMELEDGAFEVYVPAGKHDLEVTAPGYLTLKVPGVVIPEPASGREAEPLSLVLERGMGISGRVVGPDGQGIPGASIGVCPAESHPCVWTVQYQQRADGDGAFVISGLPFGTMHLAVEAAGFVPLLKPLDLKESISGLTLVLGHGVAIEGIVRKPDGAPIAEAKVDIRLAGLGGGFALQHTDHAGRFAFEGRGPGVHELQASWRGAESKPVRVPVGTAAPPPVVLTIGANVRIEGFVSGLPPGELVGLQVEAHGTIDSRTTTDTNGRFAFEEVPPGSVVLSVTHGDVTIVEGLSVDGDEPVVSTELGFKRGSRLYGTVTAGGKAVPGARVSVDSSDEDIADDTGRYEIPNVPDGKHEVRASFQEGSIRSTVVVDGDTRKDIAFEPGAVRGRVVDAASGASIAEARIDAYEPPGRSYYAFRAESDAAGGFAMELGPGTYSLVASATGHGPGTAVVTIAAGETLEDVNIELPQETSLAARITDSRTGMPPGTVEISVMAGEIVVLHDYVVGEGGLFPIPGLGPGRYTLALASQGSAVATVPDVEAPGEVAVRLSAPGRVRLDFSVYGTMRLLRSDGTLQWCTYDYEFSAQRRFLVVQPPRTTLLVEAGSYRVVLTDLDGKEHAASVTVREGGEARVTLP